MAVATGLGFDVTQLERALSNLDNELKSVIASSEVVRNNFKQIFDPRNTNFALLQSIEDAKKGLLDISKIKDPLQWDSKSVQHYIDKVNEMFHTLNALNNAAGFNWFEKADFKQLGEALTNLRKIKSEVLDYEKRAEQAVKANNQTYAGAMAFSSAAKSMEQEKLAIENLRAAREKLSQTDVDYATKLNALNVAIQKHEKSIKEASKTDKQRADEAQENARKIVESTRRETEAYERRKTQVLNKWYSSSATHALDYSKQAKSIIELQNAIKYLEAARSKENLQSEKGRQNYRTLTEELQRQKKTYEGLVGTIKTSHKGLVDITGQLAKQFATLFSVSQIRGYINKLAEVRGEFELQQRSLQAILQNKNEANDVWNKTVDLAVRSPFRVKELVSYTKQLAAYRVESDKLYETNKMLADVSAGLGVDMQRLILAYGQVKSAEYLRGTELRQFTEAGIPMLAELAKHLETVKGRSFEVAEVFDMISKRMITFEDVEQVFRNMTQAGGTFYNMQEIQSETLKGQMSNLKDSIDLMLNDIGKSTEGTMKNAVSAAKFLVDNWEALVPVLKTLAATFLILGVNALSCSQKMLVWGRLTGRAIAVGKSGYSVIQMLGISFDILAKSVAKAASKMATFVATNPWLIFGAVVVATISKIVKATVDYNKRIKEVEDNWERVRASIQDISLGMGDAISAKDLNEAKKKLSQLISLANREYNLKINTEVGKLSEEQVKNAFREIENKLLLVGAKSADFAKAMEEKLSIDNKFVKDLEDVGASGEKAFQKLITTAQTLRYNIIALQQSGAILSEEQLKALADLEDKREGESTIAFFDRLRGAIATLWEDYDNLIVATVQARKGNHAAAESVKVLTSRLESLGVKMKGIRSIFELLKTYDRDVAEAEYEFEQFAKRLDDISFASMTDAEKEIVFTAVLDEQKTKRKWNDFVFELIQDLSRKRFSVRLEPKIDNEGGDDSLLAWQESYNKLFESASAGFDKIVKKATEQEAVIKRLNDEYKKQKAIVDQIKKAGTKGAYQGMTLEEEERKLKDINKQLAWFGVNPAEKGKDPVKEKLQSQISLIKEMNKEYEKLNKTYSKAVSLQKVMAAYADTAKDLGLDTSKMDFSDKGTIASLQKLLGEPQYAANKYALELKKALDNFVVEVDIETKQNADKKIVDDLQKVFDQYDLSLELKKLNIPPEIAKSLFNVDYLDLAGLKAAVQKESSKFVGTDMEGEYKKFLDKVDDMEKKAAVERMKTYSKYLVEGMNERVKLKVEELRKLKEIEDSKEFNPEQKARIKEQVSKEARKEQQTQEWKDFKGTEMYTLMFEDLEFLGTKALTTLQEKLEELKGSLSDLPADEVKEIIGQISKIEDITIERNPFAYMKGLRDELKKLKSEEELQIDLFNANKLREDSQAYIDAYNTIQSALDTGAVNAFADASVEDVALWTEMETLAVNLGQTMEQIVAEKKKSLKTGEDEAAKAVAGLNTHKKVKKTLQEQSKAWDEIGGKMDEAFDVAKELMATLGVSTDSVAMSLVESAQGMGQLITAAVQFGLQMEIVGYQSNMALGVIGWILIAIQAIAKILSAIFTAKDKALQKQVEDNLSKVELLQEGYEKLEDAIDKAWNVADIQQYNAELKKTTEEMIIAQKAAIKAQEQRKGANKEGSDVYNELQDMYNELDELEAQLEESLADSFSKVTDGILDDVHSAAKEFTDAWYEAYAEAGDGLKGLEENFEEMFLNLAKNQAAMQITGAFAEQWKRDLEKYINADDTKLTQDEARLWAQKVRDSFPQLSEALESYFDAIGGVIGVGDASGLSALSKSIQGVSEETAQVLEALLSSMRFYVADSNQELKNQTRYMRDMYNLLNDMTMAHSQGGWGIKVVM